MTSLLDELVHSYETPEYINLRQAVLWCAFKMRPADQNIEAMLNRPKHISIKGCLDDASFALVDRAKTFITIALSKGILKASAVTRENYYNRPAGIAQDSIREHVPADCWVGNRRDWINWDSSSITYTRRPGPADKYCEILIPSRELFDFFPESISLTTLTDDLTKKHAEPTIFTVRPEQALVSKGHARPPGWPQGNKGKAWDWLELNHHNYDYKIRGERTRLDRDLCSALSLGSPETAKTYRNEWKDYKQDMPLE